jgi:hypothetical protein
VFRWWPAWVAVGLIGVVGAAVAVFYLRPRPLTPAYQPTGAGSTWFEGFSWAADQTVSFMSGWIAQFGWMEIPLPAVAIAIWACVGGGLLLVGVTLGPVRLRIAALLVGAAIVLVPPFSQAAVVGVAGFIWQGRYTLAPAVMLLVLAGIGLDRALREPGDDRRTALVVRVVIVLLAVGQAGAFLWMLRRYVTGMTATTTWLDLVRAPLWQPPGGWLLVALVALLATAAGAVLVDRAVRGRSGVTSVRGPRAQGAVRE